MGTCLQCNGTIVYGQRTWRVQHWPVGFTVASCVSGKVTRIHDGYSFLLVTFICSSHWQTPMVLRLRMAFSFLTAKGTMQKPSSISTATGLKLTATVGYVYSTHWQI